MDDHEPQDVGRTLAILGAGPAGLYAARAAAASGRFAAIDVIEALPAPYGLVRYGVAPDHPETKRVTKVFDRAFDSGQVRFLGNVTVGRDIAHAEFVRYYDAVVYATGVSGGRRLSIPGADLPGSVSSADFVSWYSGHPEARLCPPLSSVRRAVVIGGGNVALDVARLLVSPHQGLRATDMPDDVLDVFLASAVREVHVMVRKGPGKTRYSPVVLREFAELPDVAPKVDRRDVEAAGDTAEMARAAQENLEMFQSWTECTDEAAARSMQFHFWTNSTEIVGIAGVEEVHAVATAPGSAARELKIPADLVVHCVGFGADGPDWLPSSATSGVVENLQGRVRSLDGEPMSGVYVAGWLKRGPSGTIATNRADAEETVACILEDLERLPRRVHRMDVLDTLTAAGVAVVSWSGWRAIQDDEQAAGQGRGAATVKLSDRDRMVAAANLAPSRGGLSDA
ncbi:FAD-dependent oxidoreductase [Streptomyces sp. B21-101]|uniref:FAD-dependent oxidoreductase n=1 Tax=Streptomyces sp. B21-101 TaxID=3039415 RepID=UPI002FF16FA7